MAKFDTAREDAQLRALFRDAAGAVPDDGFTARVQARLTRRLRTRRFALAAAALAGVALAWEPLVQLSGWFGRATLALARQGTDPGWFAQHPGWPLVLVLMLAVPVVVRWLER